MGNATDHTFTYEKVDGNVGGADIIDGVIVMSISNNCSLSNGVHESSHGYDFWKMENIQNLNSYRAKLRHMTVNFLLINQVCLYLILEEQNLLNDIDTRWVLGVNSKGDYIYINKLFPGKNPKKVLESIK